VSDLEPSFDSLDPLELWSWEHCIAAIREKHNAVIAYFARSKEPRGIWSRVVNHLNARENSTIAKLEVK